MTGSPITLEALFSNDVVDDDHDDSHPNFPKRRRIDSSADTEDSDGSLLQPIIARSINNESNRSDCESDSDDSSKSDGSKDQDMTYVSGWIASIHKANHSSITNLIATWRDDQVADLRSVLPGLPSSIFKRATQDIHSSAIEFLLSLSGNSAH